jgi:hypothetical protein
LVSGYDPKDFLANKMPPGVKMTNTLRKPYADDDDGDDLVYDPETLPSILPPKVKKVKGPKTLPPPKPTKRSKSAARKIAKLEEEKAKKLKRGELYASLAATAIPEEHLKQQVYFLIPAWHQM